MRTPETARAAHPRDAGGDPQNFERLGGAIDDQKNSLPSQAPQDVNSQDEPAALCDLRLLGTGLTACERALNECGWPISLHEPLYLFLFALGVREHGSNGRGPFGPFGSLQFADVLFHRGGRFAFARDVGAVFGLVSAIIIPVHDETGDIVDVAAWNPDDSALALWNGVASMLGAENILAPRLDEPLLVHETPLDWLCASRRGVFIVDPIRAAPLLRLGEPLGVKREAHGRRLRQSLTIPAPRIVVASSARAVA